MSRSACAGRLTLMALPGLPLVQPGDDLAALIGEALERAGETLVDDDVVVVTSKVVSRAEGRFVDLAAVEPSPHARALAAEVDKDPAVVELILRESVAVSRKARGVLIVRHRLGFVSANAGIDASNAGPPPGRDPERRPGGADRWVLLLPGDPDGSAAHIRRALARLTGVAPGVVLTDSHGRPFRLGTVGAAIGVAGLPALLDMRGEPDLLGRPLEHTVTALADQVAAAADLVAGQAAEAHPVVLVRGLAVRGDGVARELVRPLQGDLYA